LSPKGTPQALHFTTEISPIASALH